MEWPRWRVPWRPGIGRLDLDADTTYAPALVAVVGNLTEEQTLSAQNTPQLVAEKHVYWSDGSGLLTTLFDVRDALGVERADMNQYVLRILARIDLDGDGAVGDDIGISLVSDGAGETMNYRINDYGQTTPNWNGEGKVELPCAYISSIDTCWRTLSAIHWDWGAGETHKTHFQVEIFKRPLTVKTEVV